MSNKNTQGYSNKNLSTLKELAINSGNAIGSETITVGASVIGLTSSFLDLKPTSIHCYVRSSITTIALTYTVDGSTPVAGTGIGRFDNDEFNIEGFSNIQRFKAIREAAGTHTIYVTYYK